MPNPLKVGAPPEPPVEFTVKHYDGVPIPGIEVPLIGPGLANRLVVVTGIVTSWADPRLDIQSTGYYYIPTADGEVWSEADLSIDTGFVLDKALQPLDDTLNPLNGTPLCHATAVCLVTVGNDGDRGFTFADASNDHWACQIVTCGGQIVTDTDEGSRRLVVTALLRVKNDMDDVGLSYQCNFLARRQAT